jgi:hypothetical protein
VQVAERILMELIVVILCLVSEVFSQDHTTSPLSPVSQKITDAYNTLATKPNSKQIQKLYLETLPNDYKTFERVFDPPDFTQLYDSSDKYLFILNSIADSLPNDVCHKLISLAKHGELYLKKSAFIADAPNYLQHITIYFATKHPKLFVDSIKVLSKSQQDSLVTFLADVENHDSYDPYTTFIEYLKDMKENKLLKLFLHAKKERVKYKHHGE